MDDKALDDFVKKMRAIRETPQAMRKAVANRSSSSRKKKEDTTPTISLTDLMKL